MGLIGVHIHVAVPLLFGVYRQNAYVEGKDLEQEFHKFTDLMYNKGL